MAKAPKSSDKADTETFASDQDATMSALDAAGTTDTGDAATAQPGVEPGMAPDPAADPMGAPEAKSASGDESASQTKDAFGEGSKVEEAAVGPAVSPAADVAPMAESTTREFLVVSPIDHDGERYAPGRGIKLTREAFGSLRAVNAVAGSWVED